MELELAVPVQVFWTQEALLLLDDQMTPLRESVPPVGSTPSEQNAKVSKARVWTLTV